MELSDELLSCPSINDTVPAAAFASVAVHAMPVVLGSNRSPRTVAELSVKDRPVMVNIAVVSVDDKRLGENIVGKTACDAGEG